MVWQYRIIHKSGKYAIHEVYYDDQGEPWTCSEEPVHPAGDTLEELRKLIHADLEAVVDICTRIQRQLEKELDPKPYVPSDPEARTAVRMGDLKEAQIGARKPC